MNKHFEDARYYIKRAGEHAKKGVTEELEPVEARFRELTGSEQEPEPSRLDNVREELEAIEDRAEGEAKDALAKARRRIRGQRPN
ncbi:hypothetical protein [Halostella sp. PRR32]|uniref:DUF7553 family protein n=1 Tax=Halostella sp. PRR32 TaxID=3098147 RepID=UPI002B1D2413|nr:hypothetical protein [Halostella sp. PRR32]